jgi:choline dehydrogenase
VLSAGAIATPGVLLRSGIGPRAKVERLGVPLVADVPAVAARLLDHPGAAVFFIPKKWGPHAGVPVIQTMLRYTSRGSPYPNDMQLQPGSYAPFPLATLPCVSLMCCVGKPSGHGTIEFTSADPRARPRIDGRILVDPADRERAVEAVELMWELARSAPMRGFSYTFWPGEGTLRSRDRIREWIWRSCGSGYHPCGTAPMGPEGDPDAAVDQYGRVRGVTGLFVADASIMPTVPSANTNIPTLMMGERFGEWLRDGVI